MSMELMIGNLRGGSAANVGVSARRRFEIELPIVEQGELELSANLGCVRQIQEEPLTAKPLWTGGHA